MKAVHLVKLTRSDSMKSLLYIVIAFMLLLVGCPGASAVKDGSELKEPVEPAVQTTPVKGEKDGKEQQKEVTADSKKAASEKEAAAEIKSSGKKATAKKYAK
jgi:hypothetical protein